VDSSGPKDAEVQSYSPGAANVRRWEDTPSVYGGDAPYVKLLWPLVVFGHDHLDSRTDSLELRAEYCIVGIPHNKTI